jgi:putative MFS transporter
VDDLDDLGAEPNAFAQGRGDALRQGGRATRDAPVQAIFWTCSIVPLFAIYALGPKILGALGLTGSLGNYGSAFITVMFLVGCLVAMYFLRHSRHSGTGGRRCRTTLM